ncbi:MAG TPA: hypothetical protein VMS76_13145 [Planctomycetota bacterium]|nr:hypothetical protein [Planctomycetota bacterium]
METPIPNPPSDAPAPLAAALLPVLLHRVNNTTQLVTSLNAVLAQGGASRQASCGAGLAEAARESDELGWALGVIACGLGADLLLARHERAGLRPLLALVRGALRREGRDALLPERLPDLEPLGGEGWHTAWAVSELVWLAGSSLPRGMALRFELESEAGVHVLRADHGAAAPLVEAGQKIERELAGARFACQGEAWSLTLPGPWMRPAP